ncbi:MAG: GatB/YqeY domain-containing protein [Patescibacteria group bacterium]
MDLKTKLADDLKSGLKSRQSFNVGVIRLLLAALHNRSIEKRGKGQAVELSPEEILEVLSREAKKRKEAADIFSKAGRRDLAEKESKELEIIKFYLPEQASPELIEKIAREAIQKTGAKEAKDFGRVMGEALKSLKGKADAGVVSATVKKILGL